MEKQSQHNGVASNGHALPEPAPTPAAEFRRVREQGETITLPTTKRVVQMRTVKPAALLRLGKIPDPLSELVMRILYGQMSSEEYKAFFALPERKEQALELSESLRVVCTAALIHPRLVDEPGDDEIHIDDLEDSEQRYIFDLALLEASELRRFRRRQAQDVGDVADEQEPELPPQPAAGN